MTKGPVALVLIGGFFASAWIVGGDLRALTRGLHWGRGLFVAALAAAPWFIWMHGRFGPAFVQGYILAGNVFYLTQPLEFSGRAVSHTFYLRAFFGGFFPWTVVMAGRGIDLLRGRWTGLRWSTEEKLLWLWVALIVGLFSVARFKLDHYIFPAAPACCILAAKAWRDAATEKSPRLIATRASVLLLAGLLIAGGAFLGTSIFELELDLPSAAMLLPVTLIVGGGFVLARSARAGWHVPTAPAGLLATLLAAYCVVVTIGFPTLQRVRPTALAARVVRDMTSPDTPIGIYRLEPWRASLRYYAERPLAALSTPEDVAAFVSPKRPVYVLMFRREYRELRLRGLRLREVFKCRAVVGTTRIRTGLRRQKWDDLIIVTDAPERRRPTPLMP